jgi:cytochrome c
MTTPSASLCAARRALLTREMQFRTAAEVAPDFETALTMAATALNAQKARHAHETACPVCHQAESQGAV